jgi:hypothetical protein
MNDNIKIGSDIHAGDGGYSIGTQEKYDEFAKGRNQSLGKMRIKELMSEVGTDTSGKWMGIEHAEKFALLIVEECRTVVVQVYRKTPLELCGPLLTADGEIAKHFYGVEE